MKKNKNFKIDLVKVILFIAPFLTGLISYWSNFLISIICIVGILIKVIKSKKIILPKGKEIILLLIYLSSFLIVNIYAIDKGMNIFYFLKNLSIVFFIVLLIQYKYTPEDRKNLLEILPYSGVGITLFSVFLLLCGNETVFFNNRLQGVFKYANAFGLFLLISIVITLVKEKIRIKDIIVIMILMIGIIFTNSRAIIILTMLSIISIVFINKNNYKKILAILFIFLALLMVVGKLFGLEKRVNNEMLESGEFTTRLLYYNDALSMIAMNPFGYGGDGWYYKQVEIQTGVYDTKYVHNSVLQVILDVGVVPFVCLATILLVTFFHKKQNLLNRMLLILIIRAFIY